jgi:hypothetical protein
MQRCARVQVDVTLGDKKALEQKRRESVLAALEEDKEARRIKFSGMQ